MYSDFALSRRYAKALVQVCVEKNLLNLIEQDFSIISDIVVDEAVGLMIKKAAQCGECSQNIVEALCNSSGCDFTAETKNFVRLLFENGRGELLHDVLAEFESIVNKLEKREKVIIETSSKLEEHNKARFIAKITKDLGENFYFEFRDKKELIGGYRIIFRSKVLDATVKNRIERISKMIKL